MSAAYLKMQPEARCPASFCTVLHFCALVQAGAGTWNEQTNLGGNKCLLMFVLYFWCRQNTFQGSFPSLLYLPDHRTRAERWSGWAAAGCGCCCFGCFRAPKGF
uniref:Putative secreted protein n=1 Tax=Ixodes ricinus TaxID=34613 RepID=A0A090XCY9_IXORI